MRVQPALITLAVALAVIAFAIVACRSRGTPTGATDAYAFTLTANDGTPYPLAQHRGQPLLLVNTASRCGFTTQYDGLEALHRRFAARGLVVICQPANDFLGQEPGNDQEIGEFCRVRFGVTFPLMAKAPVSGQAALPLYRWLTGESAQPGLIRWNFTKFVIGRDGRVVARFGPSTDPAAPDVAAAIEGALTAGPGATPSAETGG